MPWYLVEGWLEPPLSLGQVAEDAWAIRLGHSSLPILASGQVREIVFLEGEASCPDPRLSIRPLGRFERIWRMAYRVARTWWHLGRRRKVIGLTLGLVLRDLPQAYARASWLLGITYPQWIALTDTLSEADRAAIRRMVQAWDKPPRFAILPLGPLAGSALEASLKSQLYPHYVLTSAQTVDDEDWVLLLRPEDSLAEHALFWIAAEARAYPHAAMIYADDDEIEAGERCRPRFKPDWSLTHLREIDYIGRACAIRGRALREVGGVRPEHLAGDTWALLLRVGEQADDRVRHIPAVLMHRDAGVEKLHPVTLRRVHYPLPEPAPKVSIVVPTQDAAALLRQCVESVLAKTVYPDYELVVVDNGSREPAALEYLAELERRPRVRLLRWDRPFNYSAINNFAVRQAAGEVVCLLNNDTEVITHDWLTEMVSQLARPGVGVVGAKLFYPDGRVQHAGDTVGPGGCANHLFQFLPGDAPGYCHRAVVAQELSAVTAACMVTWRRLYLELGGLNECWLPVAFNDVDYCLRVRRAGFRVVFTPHARLYHHESVSRGKDRGWRQQLRAWREVRYMRWKWRREMRRDPFYNPNFSYLRPDYALGPAPNVRRPWREQG